MESRIRINTSFKIIALLFAAAMTMTLMGCSSSGGSTQPSSSQTIQDSQSKEKANSDVFSIDFPTEPEYKYSQEASVPSETYIAKTDDCYVLIKVDRVTLNLEGENPYDFAASLAYSFLDDVADLNITEADVDKGTRDGHPAGYVSLESQDGSTFLFGTSILGDDYVLNCIVQANTNDKIKEIVKSLSVK